MSTILIARCWRNTWAKRIFEASAIIGPTNGKLRCTVAANITEGWEAHRQFDSTFAFLPAPLTWLEYRVPVAAAGRGVGTSRRAIVIHDQEDGTAIIDEINCAYDPARPSSDALFPG
jgi:hypothetical protein